VIATDFAALAREVEPGSRVLLSDGRIELKVRAIHGEDVECEVLNGGPLKEQQASICPARPWRSRRSRTKTNMISNSV